MSWSSGWGRAGRTPQPGCRTDLAALGVGAVGLEEQARTIDVDERMRAADRVWAIGNVTGKGAIYAYPTFHRAIADALGSLNGTG